MNKWTKIGIIGSVVLILVVLLYFFGFKDKKEGYISDDWTMTYDPDDRGPYGTYMLKELMDTTGMFGNFIKLNETLEKTLEDEPGVNDIYFFVGSSNYLADSTSEFLLDFVSNGNTVFMAAEYFPSELIDEICYDRDDLFEEDLNDSVQFLKFQHPNFKGKRYKFEFVRNNKVQIKTWHYFDEESFYAYNFDYPEDDQLSRLGSNTKNKSNFVKIEYGDGQLFLHSAPYTFTNISMMRRDGFQYAENVLRHVPPGRVQWDKYNLDYHSGNNNESNRGGGEKRESMMQFIMNNPPLLWAFLILLIGAILYALFKGKRMQKVVPATESKKNMSLQYINTLSSLYLQEKKHNKLIKLKEKTFLNFIADHYYIHSSKPDDKFFNKVAQKSHVSKEKIVDIFISFDELERAVAVSDQDLIGLHQKIENFYKTCR